MNVYLITNKNKSATTYNKRAALTLAKKHSGSEVYAMPYQFYKHVNSSYPSYGWDAYCFKYYADRIYPTNTETQPNETQPNETQPNKNLRYLLRNRI